ncbi:erythromycin esterase family protein [Bacillus sp. AK128]
MLIFILMGCSTVHPEEDIVIKRIEVQSERYNDLEFLEDILRDKRIVMLGESSHGVLEYNLLKGRLVKYLHEEMGYNVLAFESGFAELAFMNNSLDELSPEVAMQNSLFGVWHTTENVRLFSYLKEQQSSKQPLSIAGFDFQRSSHYPSEYLHNYFVDLDPDLAEGFKRVEESYLDLVRKNFPEEEKIALINQYKSLSNMIEKKKLDENDKKIFIKVIEQRIYTLTDIFTPEYNEDIGYSINVRDEVMADYFMYLIKELYPDEKFIVWAHNSHIMKNKSKIKPDYEPYYVHNSFVENLPERVKEESYIIGFYMYEGHHKSYDGKTSEIDNKHQENSIENYMYVPEYDATFLDLALEGDKWWNRETSSKYWGELEESFIPSEQYNGLILINEVNPPFKY